MIDYGELVRLYDSRNQSIDRLRFADKINESLISAVPTSVFFCCTLFSYMLISICFQMFLNVISCIFKYIFVNIMLILPP